MKTFKRFHGLQQQCVKQIPRLQDLFIAATAPCKASWLLPGHFRGATRPARVSVVRASRARSRRRHPRPGAGWSQERIFLLLSLSTQAVSPLLGREKVFSVSECCFCTGCKVVEADRTRISCRLIYGYFLSSWTLSKVFRISFDKESIWNGHKTELKKEKATRGKAASSFAVRSISVSDPINH
jgi:hypothetical protein